MKIDRGTEDGNLQISRIILLIPFARNGSDNTKMDEIYCKHVM